MEILGQFPEWPKGADCKFADESLHRFESCIVLDSKSNYYRQHNREIKKNDKYDMSRRLFIRSATTMNKPCEDCSKESKKVWAYGLGTQAIICEECFDERAVKCKHTKGWTRWDCRPDECKECGRLSL